MCVKKDKNYYQLYDEDDSNYGIIETSMSYEEFEEVIDAYKVSAEYCNVDDLEIYLKENNIGAQLFETPLTEKIYF